MCNRAGGLIARVLESYQISTVSLSINLSISQRIGCPRTVFVKFPHGASFGEPGGRDQQLTVLRDMFWALQNLDEPGGIVEPGYRWRRTTYSPVPPESFQREVEATAETP
ncbi:MAG: hypothetical protein DRI90_20070 [Deltaproteobacteria bacterium]|nr:MAG: hypothetical protein DRI90_20070 [Deltaproteobacteria bacterium]